MLEEGLPCVEICFNPLKLPGIVGEELEDILDLGVESWLLGVSLTEAGDWLPQEGSGLLDPEYLAEE